MALKKQEGTKWIALGKVLSINGSKILDGASNAYVNILGFSKNRIEFRNQAKNKLNSMGLKLLRMEDAEPFKDRISKVEVSREIKFIAKKLSNKNNIEFSTFHTYD